MRKRKWLVEDNLVALYIALHKYNNLRFKLQDIKQIITHKGFGQKKFDRLVNSILDVKLKVNKR